MTIPEQAKPLQVEIAEQIARDTSCSQGEFNQRVLSIIPYLADVCDRASLMGVERAALPPQAREEICGACGHPWTGEKCGQAENDHPFPTCYPVSSTAGQEWRDILPRVIVHLEDGEGHDEGAFDESCDTCLLLRDLRALLPAPLVAEPIVAEQGTK